MHGRNNFTYFFMSCACHRSRLRRLTTVSTLTTLTDGWYFRGGMKSSTCFLVLLFSFIFKREAMDEPPRFSGQLPPFRPWRCPRRYGRGLAHICHRRAGPRSRPPVSFRPMAGISVTAPDRARAIIQQSPGSSKERRYGRRRDDGISAT